MKKRLHCADALYSLAACGLLLAITAAGAHDDDQPPGWTMGGQNLKNWRNQDETKISPHNVAKLKTKWVFTTGGDVGATPAIANGVVYFPDFAGNFYAVEATTGKKLWHHQLADWTGVGGDFARNDPTVYKNMVILGDQAGNNAFWNGSKFVGDGAKVIAVDARTGKKIWVTQVDPFPTTMVTSSPVVYNDIVYVGIASAEENAAAVVGTPCCVSRGSMVALDVHTGKKI
jgi:polyvinyl alcohol dehydrogenase (cytochrome)